MDERMAISSLVIVNIKFDQVAYFAQVLRKSLKSRTAGDDTKSFEKVSIGPAILRSCHILYPLHFEDGVQWLLKNPINGTPQHFGRLARQALTTEALTMKLIRQENTIPIPEVFAFASTVDREIEVLSY